MWVKKVQPVHPNVLEQQKRLEEEAKIRAAFWARRRVQTAQPRTKFLLETAEEIQIKN